MKTLLIALVLSPGMLPAQASGAGSPPPQRLTEAQQIASAVLPLPKEYRDDGRVLGYKCGSRKLSELRPGKGAFICLASEPAATRFHVACYHKSMEPFMARGRALRDDVERPASGMRLESHRTGSAGLGVVATRREESVIDITVHEGKNRQVRRMFEAVGHPVLLLARLRFGPLKLGDLPSGATRTPTPRELAALRAVGSRAGGGE